MLQYPPLELRVALQFRIYGVWQGGSRALTALGKFFCGTHKFKRSQIKQDARN